MIVQVIPVRTTGPVQTESTDSTAAAHQDIMEHNVKQVTISKIHCPSYFRSFEFLFSQQTVLRYL